MYTNLALGILLVAVGGIMEGTYAVPTRYTPRWKWEHIWGAGSLLAIVLIGWPIAFLTVPESFQVLREAGTRDLIMTALFGAGWGLGGIFFGLGVEIVGIAVGVSLILGLIGVVGSALPLLLYRPEQLGTPGGELLLAALAIMVVGIVLCGYAGSLHQRAQHKDLTLAAAAGSSAASVSDPAPRKHSSFNVGMMFCVLSGLLSPLVNFGLIKGDAIRALAIHHGASSLWATNAVWLVVFTANYGVLVLYALFLMMRHRTFSEWGGSGTGKYWLLAAVMGFLWAGGVIVYGTGVTYMGALGAYAGWPLLLIAAISAGNISGIIMGEWKGASTKASRVMGGGLAVLFLAAVMLGFANRMLAA